MPYYQSQTAPVADPAAAPPPEEQAPPAEAPLNISDYEQAAPVAAESAPDQPLNIADYATAPAPGLGGSGYSTEPAQPAALPPATPRAVPQQTMIQQIPGIGGPLQSVIDTVSGHVVDPALQGANAAVGTAANAAINQRAEAPPPLQSEVAPYRPAGEGTNLGPESYGSGIDAARKTLEANPSPGNLLQLAGAYKDMNKGGATPFMADNQRTYGEEVYRVAADPNRADPGFSPTDVLTSQYGTAVGANAARNDPNIEMNRDLIIQAYEQGYTSPEGISFAPGGEAVWELMQGGRTVGERAAMDFFMSPIDAAADVVSGGLGKLGEVAATRGLSTTSKALEVASAAIDAPATGGLSLAVPGALKGLGKAGEAVGILAPSKQGLALQAGEDFAEAAAPAADEAFRAGTLADAASPLTTPAKGVTRLTTPSADLAYDVDPTYGLRVYDDPAAPSSWRPPTEADLTSVMGALRELPQDARKVVREPWFDWGMKHQGVTGDDFIDPLAPDLPARAGLPAVSTGRNAASHQAWIDDTAEAIRRFDDPTGNRPVLGHLLQDWERSLYDGGTHGLTGRTQAEHRLQSIRNVLAEVPEHNDHYAMREVARMERMLPAAPGTIGTGFTSKVNRGAIRGGGVATATRVAYTPVQTARMQKLATIPAKELWGTGGKGGKGLHPTDFSSGLLSRYPGTSSAAQNFGALLDHRLATPVLKRGDVGAIRTKFSSAVGAPLSVSAQKELDTLKLALERNGIVPGATALPADQIDIALAQWLKNPLNARFEVAPPPGGMALGPTRPLGIYTPGSASETLGVLLDDPTEELLSRSYEVNGVTKNPLTTMLAKRQEISSARSLAAEQTRRALTPLEQTKISTFVAQTGKLFPEYRGMTAKTLADMSPEEMSRLAAATIGKELSGAKAAELGIKLNDKNAVLAAYDGFNQMIRSLMLYSPARGIAYPLMQFAGNLFTLGIANRRAIEHYNPLELATIVKFMKNPEGKAIPDVVRWREGMGLGRSGNIGGRVSRDQMGPYTFFSGPDAGAFRKNLGKVLAPQWIKNWADAGDGLHRLSLYKSVMDPGYTALKRALPDWSDEVFQEARVRTGMPLPLAKADMESAIRTLEQASPTKTFTPVELRQALFDAAGGTGAANKTELMNAADRVHRLYREKLGELDTLAQKEVNRVAFDPMETNLDRILQRTFLFSWWNTRAANLFSQEIAKSPIMLGMFSRAVADGQRGMMEGRSEGQQNWIEFMRSPAGFAMSLNPLTLSSSFLSMAGMEQPPDKAQLTGLGRFFEGGMVGNNLFLSPLLKASLGWLGAFGRDYSQQDLTGLKRYENLINRTLDVVNREVYTFHATKGGNPDLIPNLNFNAFQGFLHEAMSGKIDGTMEVPPLDAQRSEQGQYGNFVAEEVLRLNPELANADADGHVYAFEEAVREAMANPDSEIAQAAMENYTQSLFAGPLSDKGGPMAVLGAALRENLPLQMQSQPSNRIDYWARKNRDAMREDGTVGMLPQMEKTAVDTAMGHLPYETPEGRALEMAKSEYYGNDPAQRLATDTVAAIRYGTPTEPVTPIDGITFTPEQILAMSAKDRSAVAYAWLDNKGLRDEYDAAYDHRNEVIAANPDLANTKGWEQYARQYEGGPGAALDATALVNPNVAKAAQDPELQALRTTDPEEFATQVGYLGPLVAGIKTSRFDDPVDPKYAGVVGGLDGTVGAWLVEKNADKSGESGVGSADEQIAKTVADLNAYDPSGATAAEYQANLAAGSTKPIPYAAYKAGVKGYVPGAVVEYNNNERTIQLANEFASGTYVPDDPVVAEEPAATTSTQPTVGNPYMMGTLTNPYAYA